MRLRAALTLPTLAACSATGAGPSARNLSNVPINLASLPIANADLSNYDDDLQFRTIDPVTAEISRISVKGDGQFMASGPQLEAGCLDIVPANAGVADALRSFQDRSNTRTIPEVIRFRIVIDGIAEIPSSRGSYQMLDNELIISSAAWYLDGGEQRFLFCPSPGPKWLIHRVVSIEPV